MVQEALAIFAAQDAFPEDYEIVIVDYHPDSDCSESVEEFNRTHAPLALNYFKIQNGSRARAINAGVKQANAPLVVILADDFMPNSQFVTAHLQFHQENSDEEIVGIGPALFPDHLLNCDFRKWLEDSGTLFGVSFTTNKQSIPENFFYIPNTSLKKSFFLKAGGLDEDFPYAAWDDYELGLRLKALGMRCQLVAQGFARHEHPVTLSERSAAMAEAAASAVIFEGKYSGRQPWHTLCDQPPWKLRAKGQYWRVKHFFTHNKTDRENFYRKMMDASFVAAYYTANER